MFTVSELCLHIFRMQNNDVSCVSSKTEKVIAQKCMIIDILCGLNYWISVELDT